MAATDEAAYWRMNGAWRGTNPVFSEDGHTHPGGSEAFPVGAVFLAVVATNPATLLGYGTWAAIAAGRMLVGLDAGDTDFDVAEEVGGAKTHVHADNLGHDAHAVTQPGNHVLTQPAAHGDHSGVPSHVHVQNLPSGQTGAQASGTRDTSTTGSVADALSTAANAGAANQVHTNNHSGAAVDAHSGAAVGAHAAHGSHAATDHKPPYFVVYAWKRTA